MSALTKSLHPDEKVKAGKLGSNMMKAGVGHRRRVPGVISLILGSMHGDHWKRFFYAYVIGWALHRVASRSACCGSCCCTTWCAAAGSTVVRRIARR